MSTKVKEITVYHCDRCSHEWGKRVEREPIVCPRCKSPYWNITRRVS